MRLWSFFLIHYHTRTGDDERDVMSASEPIYSESEFQRLEELRMNLSQVCIGDEELLIKAVTSGRFDNQFMLTARHGLVSLANELSDEAVTELIDCACLSNYKGHASAILAKLGTRAAPAVPRLLDRIETQPSTADSTIACLGSLKSIASEAIPTLLELIETAPPSIASKAVFAVFNIGDRSPRFKSALLSGLRSDSDMVFAACATSLGKFEWPYSARSLIAAGKRSGASPSRRQSVALGLAHVGTKASKAMPMLLKWLKDKNPNVRIAVIKAINCIHADPEDAVPSLVSLKRRLKKGCVEQKLICSTLETYQELIEETLRGRNRSDKSGLGDILVIIIQNTE